MISSGHVPCKDCGCWVAVGEDHYCASKPTDTKTRQYLHDGYEYRYGAVRGLERTSALFAPVMWERVTGDMLTVMSAHGLRVVADAMDARGAA